MTKPDRQCDPTTPPNLYHCHPQDENSYVLTALFHPIFPTRLQPFPLPFRLVCFNQRIFTSFTLPTQLVAWEHHTKLWKRNLTITINIKDIKGLKHLKLELKLPQRCTSAVCCPITVNQCKITGICSWRPWFLPHEIRLTQTKTLFDRLPTWNLHRFLAQFHPFLRFVLLFVLLWDLWFWYILVGDISTSTKLHQSQLTHCCDSWPPESTIQAPSLMKLIKPEDFAWRWR